MIDNFKSITNLIHLRAKTNLVMASSAPHVLISCGSYNPITNAHLRMFELAKYHMRMKKHIIVEKGIISPTNDAYAVIKPSLSPAFHRLAMIKLALKDVKKNWIVCDEWETQQKDWVRTLPALRHYSTIYGPNMKLLCGADLIESFSVPNLWLDEDIEEILKTYGILVLPRKGSEPFKQYYQGPKSKLLNKYQDRLEILDVSFLVSGSSTQVRDSVKEGRPIDQLVHPDVARYIEDHNLYRY